MAHFGTLVEVEPNPDEDGPQPTLQCHFRSNIGGIVAGDRVVMRSGQSHGVVSSAAALITSVAADLAARRSLPASFSPSCW
ncbi:MAG: hypothetical protein R3F38_16400 [Gammaproteobacteria bacterium]